MIGLTTVLYCTVLYSAEEKALIYEKSYPTLVFCQQNKKDLQSFS